jgi:hypothetical protein
MTLLNKATILLTILAISSTSSVSGFSVDISRRQALQAAAAGLATAVAPSLASILPAYAVVDEETPRVTTRMGGLLVRALYVGSIFILCMTKIVPFSQVVCLSSSLFTYYLLFGLCT